MLKRAILKLFLVSTLSAGLWMGGFGIGKALAFFEDLEASLSNPLAAGALDFSLSSEQDFFPTLACQEAERAIEIINHGNPFNYDLTLTDVSGTLCPFITLMADLDGGEPECVGGLDSFTCQDFLFTDPASWQFKALIAGNAPADAVCNFNLKVNGQQVTLETGGFHDEELITNTITTEACGPKVLINKVYYDVDAGHGQEHDNEWLELYNPSDIPIAITDWLLEDAVQTVTLPASPVLPPLGFALITGHESTWDFWPDIPPEVVKIVLPGGLIGDGLDNDGDRVLLRNESGLIVDQMSYEQDTTVFNPAPPLDGGNNPYDLPEGHILGRVPTGFDTDTASDWHDLGLPEVTVAFMGSTWNCGQNVTIEWEALNPNGPDSELLIDLYYIRDLDGNGIISEGDAFTPIAQNISNTGSYNWQVSPCYLGYVWIEVIAQGPENFMISKSDISTRIFEPPQADDHDSQIFSIQGSSEEGDDEEDDEQTAENSSLPDGSLGQASGLEGDSEQDEAQGSDELKEQGVEEAEEEVRAEEEITQGGSSLEEEPSPHSGQDDGLEEDAGESDSLGEHDSLGEQSPDSPGPEEEISPDEEFNDSPEESSSETPNNNETNNNNG